MFFFFAVTLISDRSPYEQGELASSSPEVAMRSDDHDETSEHDEDDDIHNSDREEEM